jgi:hypothetical protein
MFYKIYNLSKHIFDDIKKQCDFEILGIGRKGCIIIDKINNKIPLVRSTTQYTTNAGKFSDIHYDIIDCIKSKTKLDLDFNNAMMEIYDDNYRKMKYHCDQSLDLKDDSFIGIYTLYQNEKIKDCDKRVLRVKNRITNKVDDIIMDHNSMILFSLETNKKYLHKIVLPNNKTNNKWLGITFRESKSFIEFIDNIPYLNNKKIHLANDDEKIMFYKLRSSENKDMYFKYPDIDYTISESDLTE